MILPVNAQVVGIFATASSMQEAETIAHALVTRKLAACVNLMPSVMSVYEWEGKIEKSNEVLMMAKVRQIHFLS